MANCDNLFREFDSRIKLNASQKQSLRTSRDSLRKKVKEKFKEEGYELKFHRQGSFAMNTIIEPKDKNYDIDDGSYILGDDKPKEPIETLHQWIVDSAKEHTDRDPIDKDRCVRVIFADGYHVDLVLYYKKGSDHPEIADKGKGWTASDPKEFMEWFNDHVDEDKQLKRIVRYFKAWGDELRGEMPSGLIFTILAANNILFDKRDDVAFLNTMEAIHKRLTLSFTCYRPTTPTNEDLFAGYSETRRKYFMDRLASFIKSGKQALEAENQKDACPKWQRHFGERFPCDLAEDKLENAKSFDAPAFIKADSRSA
jgi:cyclic GMP-AMP synthase DncV-like protein